MKSLLLAVPLLFMCSGKPKPKKTPIPKPPETGACIFGQPPPRLDGTDLVLSNCFQQYTPGREIQLCLYTGGGICVMLHNAPGNPNMEGEQVDCKTGKSMKTDESL